MSTTRSLRRSDPPAEAVREVLKNLPKVARLDMRGGSTHYVLVLGSPWDDLVGIDLASGSLIRLRVPWTEANPPDLSAFDVVEATLAADPETDDLAHPEAATVSHLPRLIGSLRGRAVKHLLTRVQAPLDGPLLGFRGPSAPFWEFDGTRPSTALVVPTRGPQLLRRHEDLSTWVRFGWERDDVWLRCEDREASRALDAARRELLSGKELATALGFKPAFLLASLSRPYDGHCYKICVGLLPRA